MVLLVCANEETFRETMFLQQYFLFAGSLIRREAREASDCAILHQTKVNGEGNTRGTSVNA